MYIYKAVPLSKTPWREKLKPWQLSHSVAFLRKELRSVEERLKRQIESSQKDQDGSGGSADVFVADVQTLWK